MSVQSDNLDRPPATNPPPGEPVETANGSDLAAADDLDSLRAELAEIEQKADEYLRLAQRTQADFINYRRRVEEERAQQARDANVAYLQRLLPVLDDFERVMANAAPTELESNWGKGIQLVERNLRKILEENDVQRISAEGAEFDPREHEALGRAPSTDVAEGHVLHVVRPGYRKGDRVIRPAQVIVAARPE